MLIDMVYLPFVELNNLCCISTGILILTEQKEYRLSCISVSLIVWFDTYNLSLFGANLSIYLCWLCIVKT